MEPLVPPSHGIATKAVYAGLLSSVLCGYNISALNSCMDFVAIHFNWCKSQVRADCLISATNGGMMTAALYLGAAMGAFMLSWLCLHKRSARIQLVVADVFFVTGGALGACAVGIKGLLLSRILSGIGLGISAVSAPSYISEIAPVETREAHSTKHAIFIAVGFFAAEVIGLAQDAPGQRITMRNNWWWRVILGFPAFLASLQAIILKFDLPLDSVPFLLKQNLLEEARKMLYNTYGFQVPDLDGIWDPITSKLERKLEDMAMATTGTRIPEVSQTGADPWIRRSVWICFFVAVFEQLVPRPTVAPLCLAFCLAVLMASAQSTGVVHSKGRRILMIGGTAAQILTMGVIMHCLGALRLEWQGPAMFIFLSIFAVAWQCGIGWVAPLCLSEIYPQKLPGSDLTACDVVKWMTCCLTALMAHILHLQVSWLLLTGLAGVAFIVLSLWVVETKVERVAGDRKIILP